MTPYRLADRYRGSGVTEYPGGVDHPLIQWWLLKAGLPLGSHDETPWCGAFVHAILWECGALTGPTLPARARHWLRAGNPIALKEAELGWDIAVLKRAGPNQPGAEVVDAPGHVGFYAGSTRNGIFLLGGNQSDKVSIQSFEIGRVLGFRRLGAGEI